MDHEVVPRQSKSVDWLLNSSRDNFGFTLKKKMAKGRGPQFLFYFYFFKLDKCTDMDQLTLR